MALPLDRHAPHAGVSGAPAIARCASGRRTVASRGIFIDRIERRSAASRIVRQRRAHVGDHVLVDRARDHRYDQRPSRQRGSAARAASVLIIDGEGRRSVARARPPRSSPRIGVPESRGVRRDRRRGRIGPEQHGRRRAARRRSAPADVVRGGARRASRRSSPPIEWPTSFGRLQPVGGDIEVKLLDHAVEDRPFGVAAGRARRRSRQSGQRWTR